MKLFRIALMALFVAGVAACSKGGDENKAEEKAKAAVQQQAPAAQPAQGGYDPNKDADSDC